MGTSKDNAVFDCLLMTKLNTTRVPPKLVLGDTRHDSQPQFAIFIKGIDVVILEEHPNTVGKQLTGVLNAV